MKPKLLLLFLCLHFAALKVNAQWATSGSNIYNTNTGNVGIGTTSPTIRLDVMGSGTLSEVIRASNNFTNSIQSYSASSTSFHHAAFASYRSRGTTTSPSDVQSGDRIGGLYGASYIGGGFRGNASVEFYVGSTPGVSSYPSYMVLMTTPNNGIARLERMRISESGNVGIGTSSPSYLLDVNGTIRAISVIQTSDERFKENIKQFENALEKISRIGGYTYTLNASRLKTPSIQEGERIGFLAQEIQKVFPEAVSSDTDGTLGVDYMAIVPVLLEAVKELKNQLDEIRTNQFQDVISKPDPRDIELYRGVFLNQNSPNPFREKTTIEYLVPDNAYSASIIVHDLNGQEVKRFEINKKGAGSIDLLNGSISPGLYLYTLVLDGKGIITKKFISTK